MKRNGLTNPLTNTYGGIDDLAYTYSGTSSKLAQVADNQSGSGQSFGLVPTSSSYTYDVMGNLLTDGGKGLTITYNPVYLPRKIEQSSYSVKLDYTFSGVKVKKTNEKTEKIRGNRIV